MSKELTEQQKIDRDLALFGTSVVLDGKRADPMNVTIFRQGEQTLFVQQIGRTNRNSQPFTVGNTSHDDAIELLNRYRIYHPDAQF